MIKKLILFLIIVWLYIAAVNTLVYFYEPQPDEEIGEGDTFQGNLGANAGASFSVQTIVERDRCLGRLVGLRRCSGLSKTLLLSAHFVESEETSDVYFLKVVKLPLIRGEMDLIIYHYIFISLLSLLFLFMFINKAVNRRVNERGTNGSS